MCNCRILESGVRLQQHAPPGPAFLQNSWAPTSQMLHEFTEPHTSFGIMNHSELLSISYRRLIDAFSDKI